jgi:hypothetical protein
VGTANAKPQKHRVVEAMLKKVVPRNQIQRMLTGKFPHPIIFENHQSLYTHWNFASGELVKLVLWGAASIWLDWEEGPVVNPLGVVESAGKFRLICNARYLNLFLENLPFKYQKLRDILAFTEEGSYMATWDLKSGSFHVPIHPRYRKYFAFRVGNLTFAFNVLCFGFSQAYFVFTKVMQEPAIELRRRGIPLSDYIDDAFTAARTYVRCLRQSTVSAQFFSALGAYFGLPKCQFDPVRLLRWLGFMGDSRKQVFSLSEGKANKLKEALSEAIAKPSTSPRKLAAFAGKIIAASPAAIPAALYSKAFFAAIQGKQSWDTIFPTPDSVKETATFWLENLDRFNGRKWWPKPTTVTITSDASGVGFGGQIQLSKRQPVQFSGTFSETQAATSSTEREVTGYAAGLATAVQHFPKEQTEASVLILGDNQGGVSTLNNMRSSVPLICSVLKEVVELCSIFRLDLTARWIPRTELQEADDLSREPDRADWGIQADLLTRITQHFGVRIALDLFASGVNHVCDKFVAQYYTPGCIAVHAFKLDWSELVGNEQEGITWIFPPMGRYSLILSLLARFRIDALVCIGAQQGSMELIQLHNLADHGAYVSPGFDIPKAAYCCKPSIRVPSGTTNPAFTGLKVFLITWTNNCRHRSCKS